MPFAPEESEIQKFQILSRRAAQDDSSAGLARPAVGVPKQEACQKARPGREPRSVRPYGLQLSQTIRALWGTPGPPPVVPQGQSHLHWRGAARR